MKFKKYIFFAVLAMAFGSADAGRAAQENATSVDVKTLAAMMNKPQKVMVIDARSTLECLDSKIPGAICFSCDEEERALLPQDAAKDTPVIVYGGSMALTADCKAIAAARNQGFNDLRILQGGFAAWRKADRPVVSDKRIPRAISRALNPKKLSEWLKQTDHPLVIDIRSQSAYAKDHIEGALNFPLARLHVQYADIPLGRTLLVVDEDESVSFLAASYLARKGFMNISRLKGGMIEYRRGAK